MFAGQAVTLLYPLSSSSPASSSSFFPSLCLSTRYTSTTTTTYLSHHHYLTTHALSALCRPAHRVVPEVAAAAAVDKVEPLELSSARDRHLAPGNLGTSSNFQQTGETANLAPAGWELCHCSACVCMFLPASTTSGGWTLPARVAAAAWSR